MALNKLERESSISIPTSLALAARKPVNEVQICTRRMRLDLAPICHINYIDVILVLF